YAVDDQTVRALERHHRPAGLRSVHAVGGNAERALDGCDRGAVAATVEQRAAASGRQRRAATGGHHDAHQNCDAPAPNAAPPQPRGSLPALTRAPERLAPWSRRSEIRLG